MAVSEMLRLDSQKTALVIIDLQKGIVANSCTPYSAQQVVNNAAKLAQEFRKVGGFVVPVHVNSIDGKDTLHPVADGFPGWGGSNSVQPSDWAEFVPELQVGPADYRVTKHQWGAFYGTDLDLQLRRRGVHTIVLCGIATGIGVDTTAREAYQRGYQQVFARDATTGLSQTEHDYVLGYIFPRIGRVRFTEEIVAAL